MLLPRSHAITMTTLLEAARWETRKIWAICAPFEVKDRLHERGYKWNARQDGRYRAWHREVNVDQVEAELCFLEDLDIADIAPS